MPGVGRGGTPLAGRRAARAAGDVQHRALVADEQPENFDQSRGVERAGRAVGRRLNREDIGHPRHRQPLLAMQIGAEHGARRPARGAVAEQARHPPRGEARHAGQAAHGTPRRAPPRVGKHEIGIGPAADQPQQRLDMRRRHTQVLARELLELRQLHGDSRGETETFDEQLVGELREPVLDGRVQILDRLEDGERDDAVHHGARNLARPPPLRNSPGRASLPHMADEKRATFEREALVHLDTLYRVALRLTGNAADADDLVQETILKAYRAWEQYQQGTNAKAWLLTILRHAFINEYRRKARHPETTDIDAIEPFAVFSEIQDDDPQGAFFDRIVDDEVLRAIDELPEAFRETLVLSDVEGLSYQEIAGVLEVPVGTVKSRLFRARQLLQGKLYDYAVSQGYIRGTPA